MVKGFESEGVWGARGRGFQMGAVQPEGVVVHLTGQVAWDAEENIVGIGDIETQTRTCFENIEKLLKVVGGELADLVAVTTYYTDRSHLPIVQKVRCEVFEQSYEPVSTSVQVAGLGHPEFLIELTPIAVIPEARFKGVR